MISEEQVRHVANLARLGLREDEIEKMGVPPTANPLDLSNVLRSDDPRTELSQEEALSPAPERVDDLFAVPRID
jgi:aspartyl-tRNA(Asn)/glutamyl-tRNA(Gln) amidotransferase subunit C